MLLFWYWLAIPSGISDQPQSFLRSLLVSLYSTLLHYRFYLCLVYQSLCELVFFDPLDLIVSWHSRRLAQSALSPVHIMRLLMTPYRTCVCCNRMCTHRPTVTALYFLSKCTGRISCSIPCQWSIHLYPDLLVILLLYKGFLIIIIMNESLTKYEREQFQPRYQRR